MHLSSSGSRKEKQPSPLPDSFELTFTDVPSPFPALCLYHTALPKTRCLFHTQGLNAMYGFARCMIHTSTKEL